MPRKTPKPRKAGIPALTSSNRRVGRPEPNPKSQTRAPKGPQRDPRFERRPPKFPGRLGGR